MKNQIISTSLGTIILIIIVATIAGFILICFKNYPVKSDIATIHIPTQKISYKMHDNDKYNFSLKFADYLNYSEDISIFSKKNNIIAYLYGEEGLEYYQDIKNGKQYCEGSSCLPPVTVNYYKNLADFQSDSQIKDILSLEDLEKVLSQSGHYMNVKFSAMNCSNDTVQYLIGSYEDPFFMREDMSILIHDDVIVFTSAGIFTLNLPNSINDDISNVETVKSFVCTI